MSREKSFDVVIVGGSYAGLSAAMALGRAIRNVLVIDSGKPCNAQTPHSHNFLTRDGSKPSEITNIAKEQVLAYPTVSFASGLVTEVSGSNNDFVVTTSSGDIARAKKVLFTTGIKDLFPDVAGLAECWGISVIHCPYCHGYEYRNQPTGILANGEFALELTKLISNWTSDLKLFTNGAPTIPAADKLQIDELGVEVIEDIISAVEHEKGYISAIKYGNREVKLDALYAKLPFEHHCGIPIELGCDLSDRGYLQVNMLQQTTIPGIYAAGDNTTMMRSLAAAVAAGSMAGAAINRDLIFS